jgi:hypothetical protein
MALKLVENRAATEDEKKISMGQNNHGNISGSG